MNGWEDGARGSFRTIFILMAIPLGGMAMFFLWQWLNGGITPAAAARETRAAVRNAGSAAGDRETHPGGSGTPASASASAGSQVSPASPEAEEQQALPAVVPRKRVDGASIVLIIDDLGFEGQPLDRVMALDPNVNCSILPNGTRASEVAGKLHAAGFEVLCHLPMEPRGGQAPGRHAILTSMSEDEIARLTRQNIDAIPHARGVNNHMGSLATTDQRVMSSVIGALPDGMYFIDSRTTSGSVAARVARAMNVRTASRDVFLDDVVTEGAVRRQVAAMAKEAEENGLAIAIGHPHAVTLRVLAEELPALRARGFRLVRASDVVR